MSLTHSGRSRREQMAAHRELRRVAFHEAGRAVLYRHFGGAGAISVWRNSTQAIQNGESTWLGSFRPDAEPGAVAYSPEVRSALAIEEPPANWRVLCTLAGPVSESLADDAASLEAIMAAIRAAEPGHGGAESGVESAGPTWSEVDIAIVRAILLQRWREVEDEATGVIEDFKRSRRGRVIFKECR